MKIAFFFQNDEVFMIFIFDWFYQNKHFFMPILFFDWIFVLDDDEHDYFSYNIKSYSSNTPTKNRKTMEFSLDLISNCITSINLVIGSLLHFR